MTTYDEALKKTRNKPKARVVSKSKGGNVHVWINPDDLSEVDRSHAKAIHFDSRLEASVWRLLVTQFDPAGIFRQVPVQFYEDPNDGTKLTWKPDFYLAEKDIFIEVKGNWVNQDACKTEKSLFIYQFYLCRQQGLNVRVASDKPFQISQIQVENYVQLIKEMKNG